MSIKNILELNVKSVKFLGNRVLLKVADMANFGGFTIPENAQTKSSIGLVVSIGDGQSMTGKEKVEITVQPGDLVLYNRINNMNELRFAGDEKYVLIQYSDIIGVINE